LSQEELAERSGLSARAISKLECGHARWPYQDTLRRLADALGLHGAVRAEFIGAPGRRPGRAGPRLDTWPAVGGAPADGEGTASPDRAIPARLVPRQLPAVAGSFAGRSRELRVLDLLLPEAQGDAEEKAVVIVAIGGTAGVGKTTLALRWAHSMASRFPDGHLYANLRGYDQSGDPASPGEIIRGFLRALQPEQACIPVSLEDQAAMYRSLLAAKRMLVVLDNAVDTVQIRPLLPGSSGCRVLVTSRSPLPGLLAFEGAQLLSLDVLTEPEASDLLTARLGADRVVADPDAARELSRFCARLPLALCITAARAATLPGTPLADLASELRHSQNLLDSLNSGEPGTDVRAVFSWSYGRLRAPAARMFRLLSLHPGPDIGVLAAASLAGYPIGQALTAIRDLARAGLITERAPGRFTLHDLLRAYSTEQALLTEAAEDRLAATGRAVDHYLHSARAADELLYRTAWGLTLGQPAPGTSAEEFTSKERALAWLDAERPILLRLIDQAATDGFDAQTWQLAWIVRRFLNNCGYQHELLASQRTALSAACRLGDHEAQAYSRLGLGRTCTELGKFQEADENLGQALAAFREAGHSVGEAYANCAAGMLAGSQDRHSEAITCTLRALSLAEAFAADPGMEFARLTALNNVAWLYACAGKLDQARSSAGEALELFRRVGDSELIASALDTMGLIQHRLGNHGEAVDCYREALGLFASLSSLYKSADAAEHLAEAYQALGDPAKARTALRDALAVLDELRHPRAAEIRGKLHQLDADLRRAVPG
jgi:tetratricopeptide (TPR) repeat protein